MLGARSFSLATAGDEERERGERSGFEFVLGGIWILNMFGGARAQAGAGVGAKFLVRWVGIGAELGDGEGGGGWWLRLGEGERGGEKGGLSLG
ncbi:hypothetical protein TIFTF001_009402 [Ficus carica]|uniref:Uncharacterized protein n=1 Tax=Ficus carica TaxID=3494 RepID=A0AA87ZN10_FICCA|nr:hypothetical protein TIFTF001_009402 [Ficus carica]